MGDSSVYRGLNRPGGGRVTDRRGAAPRSRLCQPSAALAGAGGGAALPGPRVAVRPAGPPQLAAALEMHARCGPATLARRYPGPSADADRYLPHLLDPRHGRSYAAWSAEGSLVGLGHVLWDGADAEVAVLVRDDWQARGVGRRLLVSLLGAARRLGLGSVYVLTEASNTAMVRAMRATGLPLEFQYQAGTLVISAALGPPARAARGGSRG